MMSRRSFMPWTARGAVVTRPQSTKIAFASTTIITRSCAHHLRKSGLEDHGDLGSRTRRKVSPSALISSVLSNTAEPEIRAPRVSPVMVCVATLLPDPDSPTIAGVVPRDVERHVEVTDRPLVAPCGEISRPAWLCRSRRWWGRSFGRWRRRSRCGPGMRGSSAGAGR
jgi:hypothetical protein